MVTCDDWLVHSLFPCLLPPTFCLLYSKFCILHSAFKDDPHWTGRLELPRLVSPGGGTGRALQLSLQRRRARPTDRSCQHTIKEKAKEVYVTYNNHFQGQAIVNALQLRHRLEGGVQQIPNSLLQAYPQVGRLLEG